VQFKIDLQAINDMPRLQPDWSSAQITTGKSNTGAMKPGPDRGYPQIPSGLPVAGWWNQIPPLDSRSEPWSKCRKEKRFF
jgi:hypothetical protein